MCVCGQVAVVVVDDGVDHCCVLVVQLVSDVLLLHVGRMDTLLLCCLAGVVISKPLACWRANSTQTSICKTR